MDERVFDNFDLFSNKQAPPSRPEGLGKEDLFLEFEVSMCPQYLINPTSVNRASLRGSVVMFESFEAQLILVFYGAFTAVPTAVHVGTCSEVVVSRPAGDLQCYMYMYSKDSSTCRSLVGAS